MSRVSKEDKDFLYLLTHLRVRNTEEGTWANIIQCMEGRYGTPMSSTGTMLSSKDVVAWDAAPPMQGTTPGNGSETSGGNSASSAVACTDAVP